MDEHKCAFLLAIFLVMHMTNSTYTSKRLVLHNDVDMAAAVQTLTARIEQMGTDMAQLTTQNNQMLYEIQALKLHSVQMTNDGSVYIRWGRTSCNQNGTELVYSGFAGGNRGALNGAADYICLTGDPEWAVFNDSAQPYAPKIFGAEYGFDLQHRDGGSQFFGRNLHNHDAPCAVCRSNRSSTLMIPGRKSCYPGWTMEYWGYLVSGLSENKSPSNYACLDAQPEWEIGDAASDQGSKDIYLVEATCGTLKCPPYVQNREITCVVCSK